jgi:hypothetical protein
MCSSSAVWSWPFCRKVRDLIQAEGWIDQAHLCAKEMELRQADSMFFRVISLDTNLIGSNLIG